MGMKISMNFSMDQDDLGRYANAADLRHFYESFSLSGLEVMPLGDDPQHLVEKDMVVGVHLRCITDWMDLDQEMLLAHYRRDLDYARRMQAEYVVFHVTQVSYGESLTYEMRHSDAEVVDAAAAFINKLLDGQDYPFWFLMENLWWPGLNMLDADITSRLLSKVHYAKKGIMLDTGHFMNNHYHLQTPEDAIVCLNQMFDAHEPLLPMIRSMAFFAGEDFVLSRFFRKETEEQRVIELFTEAIAQKQEHTSDIAAVLNEVGQQLEQFALQLEALKQTQEQIKEQYEYLQSGQAKAAPSRFDAWRKQKLIRKAIADPACTAGKLKQILTDAERLTYQQLKEKIQEGDRT